ncbi:MAG TPA: DUF1801 domain-containing protein [Verrucomicrobiae bacterium]|nr:DUF1801 domain-containing protein [Verrucomicrobiae bacterium]
MRHAKASLRPTKPKAPRNVDDYIARVPEPARTTLLKVRATIRSAAPPETTEALSYGIPTFRYKGGLVAYAAFKDHCSLFPLGSSALDSFAEELKGYRASKGTLHFPIDKPMPAALVKKIVKARIAQNDNKKQA